MKADLALGEGHHLLGLLDGGSQSEMIDTQS